MALYITAAALLIAAAYLIVQCIRYNAAVKAAERRLGTYGAKTVHLGYGNMTYLDRGEGPTILSVHGIFGGYDQAYDTCRGLQAGHRIVAPSRFGYLGSDVLGNGTPREQARAFVELLDRLGIERVFLLATSAGGSVAIRFALEHPARTAGLILYSSAMPLRERPHACPKYAGPPPFLCNDRAMFLLSPLFGAAMGMAPSTVFGMLPIGKRKAGVLLDAAVTNPDMARSFDDYPIERLQCPTLILHAKDDKLANCSTVSDVLDRFPSGTVFVPFESGGHLLVGHEEEVRCIVTAFLKEHA